MFKRLYWPFIKRFRTILVLNVVLLSACTTNTDDIDDWVKKIDARPPKSIQNLPEIVEYKPHDYGSAHLRSPFADLEADIEEQLQTLITGCENDIQPDTDRRKEDLERYSLDSMEMKGIMNKPDKLWGLVKITAGPSAGNVFHVEVGDYVGVNHGRIESISEQQIKVNTLVPDNKGCWEQRTVFMTLAE